MLLVGGRAGAHRRPAAGPLTGFLAGLALDVAPPASHTVGRVRAGVLRRRLRLRAAGRAGRITLALRGHLGRGAAAVGAALHAVLGVMLSDPEVTWAAVQHVLPSALVYDVLLSPFVLYGVVRFNGWAPAAPAGKPVGRDVLGRGGRHRRRRAGHRRRPAGQRVRLAATASGGPPGQRRRLDRVRPRRRARPAAAPASVAARSAVRGGAGVSRGCGSPAWAAAPVSVAPSARAGPATPRPRRPRG